MHISLVLVAFAVVQDTIRPPAFDSVVLGRVDSIASAEFAKDSLGSISVGIVSGDALVWTKSYGYADSARTIPASPTSVYRVASVTKQLTGIMLLQLVQSKKVRLSDAVDRYVPEIRRTRGRPVTAPTLVQLATMTSGLARDPNDKRRSQQGTPDSWLRVLLTALPQTEYVADPGARYAYSNVGYAILGAALSRAAADGYIAYQRRRILRPLGMHSSDFHLTDDLRKRLAVGVDYDELYKDTLNYQDAAGDHRLGLGLGVPSGGLYSTVEDVAKLVSLQLGFGPDSVLPKEARALRDRVPVAASSDLNYGYGLAMQVYRWGDTVAVGHSGNLAGYTSMILYDPQRKFGVIVLRSAGGGNADAGRLAGRSLRKLRASLAQ